MYKLLIVDDDMLARMGMRILIDWNAYGYQVIDLVDSGETALEVIANEKPDVVFTDVVMHGMDGIELTRRIKELYPDIIVVALSCYTDVEYVKNIIKMGAEDYLQKLSFGPNDVIALLKRLTVLLDSKNQRNNCPEKLEKKNCLLKLIHGETTDDSELVSLLKWHPDMEKGFFVIRRRASRSCSTDSMKKVEDELDSLSDASFCFVRMLEEQIAVLFDWKQYEKWKKKAYEIALTYKDLCTGFSRPWKTPVYADYLHEAEEAAKSIYLHNDESVHVFMHEDKELLGNVYKQFEIVQKLLDDYDFSSLSSELEKLMVLMKKLASHPTLCRQMFSSVSAKLMQLAVLLEGEPQDLPLVSHDAAATIEESLQLVLGQLRQLQSGLSNSSKRFHPEVKKAIGYILEHYTEEITLSQIAMHVSLSESYLSSLFKKDTGKGLINYLEEYRINQALRFMNEQREPLYLIAQHVGYNSVNYFSRVFKKVRHETPSQYLERQKIVNENTKK